MTILSLGIDVARWFGSLRDELTPAAVGDLHADLVIRMIAA